MELKTLTFKISPIEEFGTKCLIKIQRKRKVRETKAVFFKNILQIIVNKEAQRCPERSSSFASILIWNVLQVSLTKGHLPVLQSPGGPCFHHPGKCWPRVINTAYLYRVCASSQPLRTSLSPGLQGAVGPT